MNRIVTAWVGAAALMSTPAAAQQTSFRDAGPAQSDGRIALGLVIPLGGKKAERAPQLELRMTRERVGSDGLRMLGQNDRPFVSRVGLSLEREQRLFVNGRVVAKEDRQGVSTLGGIAIGVGVALVVGTVLLYDALGDASE